MTNLSKIKSVFTNTTEEPTKTNLSFRSRMLVAIGRLSYGEPETFIKNTNVSAEEFYSLQVERSAVNPELHPQFLNETRMQRNLYVDQHRRLATKRLTYLSIVFAISVMAGGLVVNQSLKATGNIISQTIAKFKSPTN
jgi:hypothetical protein